MSSVVLGICYLACAFYWTALACGLTTYSPWVVTFAFAFVALDMLLAALRKFAGVE